MFNLDAIIQAFEEAKKRAKKRRFIQSVDLIVKLRDVDPKKKPEDRINITIPLPHPIPNKVPKICAIVSGAALTAVKEAKVDTILTKEDVEKMSGDKKAVRKLAQTHDFFIATPDLMPLIGRVMGPILGPRGNLPEVYPPNADWKAIVERLRRSTRVRVKDQPQFMTRVGSEIMDSKEIAENIVTVLEEIMRRKYSIDKIEWTKVKLTMGPPVEFEPFIE